MPSTVDMKNHKLRPSDYGGKKDWMGRLRDSLRDRKNVFSWLVSTKVKPGLNPENLKKSIQDGGLVNAMTEATKATIMQK